MPSLSPADLKEIKRERQKLLCLEMRYGLNGHKESSERQIANELGLPPATVHRMLKAIRREGLVRIEYTAPRIHRLGHGIEKEYGLREVIVVPSSTRSLSTPPQNALKRDLGETGARYFEQIAKDGASVGISCGYTLFEFVAHLTPGLLRKLKIYPLSAEMTIHFADVYPNALACMMQGKYPESRATPIDANLIRAADKKEFTSEFVRRLAPTHVDAFKKAKDVDIALLSIGPMTEDGDKVPGFVEYARMFGLSVDGLVEDGVVGEINYQAYDHRGSPVRSAKLRELNESVAAVGIKRLQKLSTQRDKTVLVIAGGRDKIPAIRAALRGKVCNVLITDDVVAQALLESPSGEA